MVEYFSIGTRLPKEYITRRSAILAKVDSGKTYLAGVIEEEHARFGMPFVVVDPMGAHWGIREKYPVLIMGGDHGDLELLPSDGKYIARLVVETNISVILDINQWSKQDQQHFAAEFGNELFLLHKISSSPRHVFWEEADIFAPQKTRVESLPVLDTLVRRGRQFGIGSTLITQRPAVLNKDVLTQVDIYFFMNMIAEQDIKVISELLKASNSTKEERANYINRIMKFEKGEALIFSPSWLKQVKIFKGRKKHCYHAGQTPVYGIPMRIPPILNYETYHIKNALNRIAGNGDTFQINIDKSQEGKIVFLTVLAVGALLIAIFV